MEKIFGLLTFVIAWILLNYVVSYFTGWNALANAYRSTVRPEGKIFRFRSGFGHGWCLTFIVSVKGLYIKVMFPFNIGGHAVFISLNDIYIHEDCSVGFGRYKVTFKNSERVYDLPGDVIDAINEYR